MINLEVKINYISSGNQPLLYYITKQNSIKQCIYITLINDMDENEI